MNTLAAAPRDRIPAAPHRAGPGDWRAQGLCLDEPDLFFSDDEQDISRAKALCGQCPVRLACHEFAEGRGERFGVWAGIDRARELGKRRRFRPGVGSQSRPGAAA